MRFMLLSPLVLLSPTSYFLSRRTRETDIPPGIFFQAYDCNFSHPCNQPARLNGPHAAFAFG